MAYNTNNPVGPEGSSDPRDLRDNAQIIDKFVNGPELTWRGRLGKVLTTIAGMAAEFTALVSDMSVRFQQFLVSSAYVSLGTYAAGITFTDRNQYVERGGQFYKPAMSVPLPYTTTGTWATEQSKFVMLGDNVLRQELGSATGAALVYDGLVPVSQGLSPNRNVVSVENFRVSAGATLSDTDAARAALAWIGANVNEGLGAILKYECGRLYVYDGTTEIGNISNLTIDLNGALLRRAPASQTTAKLSVAAGVGATSITLDAIPASWKVGDTVTAFTGPQNANTGPNPSRINAINQATKTVTLAGGLGAVGSNTVTLPVGTWIGKNYQCFLGRPSTEENGNLRPGINNNVHIINGSIDGNSANQLNNSWRFSMEIYINGRSSGVSGVKFSNTAGECIVGHGLRVEGCEFRNLSGSAFHTSRHDDTEAAGSASWFTSNVVDGVCLATNAVNGHSEGAVTFSWGAGRLIVTGNEFRNGNEGVLGGFGPSTGAMADKWLVFSDNICMTFNRVFWGLVAPLAGVVVANNVFIDCNDNSVEMQNLLLSPSCSAGGNVAIGNTVLSGSFRATNGAFGDDMSGTLTQIRMWARRDKLWSNYSRISDCTAAIEGNTALLAMISSDAAGAGSGVAFHSAAGRPVGSFFLQWLPSQKKFQFLGNETGAVAEFTTPVILKSRLNVILPVFANDAAAKAAGLILGDMYKMASGAVYTVSS